MLKIENLSKSFDDKEILNNLNYTFKDTGLYFIVGKSGCGKSTFLKLIGGLLEPTNGNIYYNELNINDLEYKKDVVSFIFQEENLISNFTAYDNIGLVNENIKREELEKYDISDLLDNKVKYLSGGEKQRISIIRALYKNSKILLLDEPTGSLDNKNAEIIYKELKEISKTKLVIVVSHDSNSSYKYADTIIKIEHGQFSNIEDISDFNFTFSKDNYLEESIKFSKYLSNYDKDCMLKVNNNNITNIKLNINNFPSFLKEKLEEYSSFEITFDNTNSSIENKIDNITLFNKKYQNKYLKNLLFDNKFKTIASIIITTLIIALSCFMFFVLNFSLSKSLLNAIEKSNYISHSIYESLYNEKTDEKIIISNGNKIRNIINEYNLRCDYNTISFVDGDYNFKNYKLHILDDVYINSMYGTKLNNDEIIVSDLFVKLYYPEKTIDDYIDIKVPNFKYKNSFKIKKILFTNYENSNILDIIVNSKFTDVNKEKILEEYLFSIMSTNGYKYISRNNIISFPANNFLVSDNNYTEYVSNYNSLKYAESNLNIKLVEGSLPNNINEVLINRNLKFRYNIDEVLGKTFTYKDFTKSLNINKYYKYLNMYDIVPSVKVVGVFEGDADVMVSSDFYSNIIDDGLSSFVSNVSVIAPSLDFIKTSNLIFNSFYLNPIYTVENFLHNSFKMLFIILVIILVILLLLVEYFLIYNNIKSRSREIVILLSLGIKKKQIFSIFSKSNLFFVILSYIIGLSIGIYLFVLLNNILKGPKLFNVTYNIFLFSYISPIIILFVILLTLILTIIKSLIKYKNNQIGNLLKDI